MSRLDIFLFGSCWFPRANIPQVAELQVLFEMKYDPITTIALYSIYVWHIPPRKILMRHYTIFPSIVYMALLSPNEILGGLKFRLEKNYPHMLLFSDTSSLVGMTKFI